MEQKDEGSVKNDKGARDRQVAGFEDRDRRLHVLGMSCTRARTHHSDSACGTISLLFYRFRERGIRAGPTERKDDKELHFFLQRDATETRHDPHPCRPPSDEPKCQGIVFDDPTGGYHQRQRSPRGNEVSQDLSHVRVRLDKRVGRPAPGEGSQHGRRRAR